ELELSAGDLARLVGLRVWPERGRGARGGHGGHAAQVRIQAVHIHEDDGGVEIADQARTRVRPRPAREGHAGGDSPAWSWRATSRMCARTAAAACAGSRARIASTRIECDAMLPESK